MMWSERHDNHLFVFWNGELVYKNYDDKRNGSVIFNKHWPNERLPPRKSEGTKT